MHRHYTTCSRTSKGWHGIPVANNEDTISLSLAWVDKKPYSNDIEYVQTHTVYTAYISLCIYICAHIAMQLKICMYVP